ncbi:MAG: hypothetical protein EU517_00400 [Promethearchaeota archaeon]|nr:MAG: hypothetical protein EU517_00400 [Candidatus Lokiarchaeota archaeon]
MMSLYWNDKLLKKLYSRRNKTTQKYKITTEIGRFYFYFEINSSVKEGKSSGKLLFFPNKSNDLKE